MGVKERNDGREREGEQEKRERVNGEKGNGKEEKEERR